MMAVAVSFVFILFFMCLAFTIFFWRRMKSPPKHAEPSEKLMMSYGEQRLLGGGFGAPIPNLKPRLRALKVHVRRKGKAFDLLFLIIGIIVTIFAAIFLILIFSTVIFQQSWLTRAIASNFSLLFPYMILPLFIMLGITIIIVLIFHFRFLAIKDKSPIRLINHTNKALKIHIRGTFIGEIYPGAEVDNNKVLSVYETYLIEAKDTSDNLFYSKDFSLDELDRVDWNVTIVRESHNH